MTDFEETIMQARENALTDNGETDHGLKLRAKGDTEMYIYGAPNFRKTSQERIIDLASAVVRCVDGAKLDRENVRVMLMWARELVEQLDMLDSLLLYE